MIGARLGLRAHRNWTAWALWVVSIVAAIGFAWPLFAAAVPADAREAVPYIAIAVVPALAVVAAILLDREMYTAKTIALLGVLSAIGVAIRIASTGVGGVEAVFILLVLAGRAYGARFGFLLGMLTILLSSALWGGFGPWTPFQMFACGWVGAGAGILPRLTVGSPRLSARLEIALLVAYGIVASYLFGLVMNLWYWPFAVGMGTDISYLAGAPLGRNLASFGLYSLVTSTLTWDTVRAITTAVGVVLVGPGVLAALRRAKLGRTARAAAPTPRSSEPAGDGTRTRQSTAPDEAAAPPTVPHPSARA
ncbi:ECF transporter S component [soil metagenome]